MEDFKKYFKFPLKRTYSKVFTADFNMAFDFAFKILFPNAIVFTHEQQDMFVAAFNGNNKLQTSFPNAEYKIDNGIIYIDGHEFILIRGWGYLTGVGGLGLSHLEAKKIQDELGEYLLNVLKGNSNE